MTSFFLMLVLFGGVGAFLYHRWQNQEAQVVRRLLREAPTVQVTGFPEGRSARLVGTVVADQVIDAPISRRPCVFWEIVVEEYRPSRDSKGRDTSGWCSVTRKTGGIPFLLADQTGRALIDPTSALVTLVDDRTIEDGGGNDPESWGQMFLAHHGVVRGPYRMRFREGIVEADERIAVAGLGIREPDPDPASADGYRETPLRLRLASSAQCPLLISDRPDTTA